MVAWPRSQVDEKKWNTGGRRGWCASCHRGVAGLVSGGEFLFTDGTLDCRLDEILEVKRIHL